MLVLSMRDVEVSAAEATGLADWKMIDLDVFGNGFDLGLRFVRSFGAGAIYPELGFRLDSKNSTGRDSR